MTDEGHVILIVDDNQVNRLVLRKRLSRERYVVHAAKGGEEALRLLGLDRSADDGAEGVEFDAVILDVMMPEVDGIEVLRRIRESKSANDLPVIMATARDQADDIVKALSLGANDYVVKPIDMAVLLARLRTQISLKETHLALKEAQSSLIEAAKMESVGYLAAGVAHEVRNPLAQIQMGIDAIGKSPAVLAEDGLAPVIELIGKGIEKADAIVRELMEVSMSGQLNLQPGSVNELIRELLDSAESISSEAGVSAETHLEESLPKIPFAATEMRQALSHVLRNAVEAMPNGGVLTVRTGTTVIENNAPGRISRSGNRLRSGDQAVVIEVADTGPGIPKENLQRIFDPFFTTKAPNDGPGLGLSVARKITDLHHGLISVSNRKNGPGARAVIHLPTAASVRPIA